MRRSGSTIHGPAPSLRAATLALVLFGTVPASSTRAQDLPAADRVIERYVEAIGGREANLAVTGIRMTGTLSMPGLGIEGTFDLRRASPNRTMMSATVPGILEQSAGYDGTIAWSYSNLTGPMILEGQMATQAREDANELSLLRETSLVPGRETVALTEVSGEPCYRVRLTWASGRENFDCYSRDTGLLLSTDGTELTPMGAVPYTSRISEYREFGGIRLPTRIVQETMGVQQVMTVVEVQLSAIDPADMALPPAVRALLGPG